MARRKEPKEAPVETSEPVAVAPEPAAAATVVKNPRPWAVDMVAGVEWSHYHDKEKKIYEIWLKFRDGKPSDEVRHVLKENGFRWEPAAPKSGQFDSPGAWVHPIGYETQAQDRTVAERTFRQVSDMMRKEKGYESSRSVG